MEPQVFTSDDIEDVKIIITAKGKNYSLVPNANICTNEEARQMRIAIGQLAFASHFVCSTALEDLKAKISL